MEYRPASLVSPAIALVLGAALMVIFQNYASQTEAAAPSYHGGDVSGFEWQTQTSVEAATPALRMTDNPLVQTAPRQQRWVF
ncbi:hypothetical protein HG264_12785 [Pseudomonas sp. gcc21]|uniref:hypothetical protein n=1 Tax=Pseudomonas sp. gcc21 TaxID=2726989 RepID=UPI0014526D64|nr:hypothetical protein [Pseudomonas sp. gcc21]QJD59719.1 hypothetical protein HG264_12785 [Pseudomonas sp. gcc21]